MRQANMTVARIAEFAWSRLEPADGRFELGWLERAVDLAARHGIRIVLGTPTAAPPAWLTRAHPEVLAERGDGRRAQHGQRGHYAPGSTLYRRFCARIAETMAQRFGRHENVIGWQIDNEYWSVSQDPESLNLFRDWLRRRYGSLEALNAA